MRRHCSSCPKLRLLLCCLLVGLHLCSNGQGTTQLLTKTYDTLLKGNGYGTYTITFPQWNSDSGMLVSATVNAQVTQHYGFTLKDVDAISSTYAVTVGREDQITGPGLGSAGYDSLYQQSVGSWALIAGGSVTVGPLSLLTNRNNVDSITGSTAPLLGTGTVTYTYSPFTYAIIRNNNSASYSYATNSITDTIRFILTYYYTPTHTVLAANFLQFNAALQDQDTVALNWSVANEQPGRQYEVEAERPGGSFVKVTTVMVDSADIQAGSAALYNYSYPLPINPQGIWLFRIKITDARGNVSYSPIKSLTLSRFSTAPHIQPEGLSLFPNPATGYVNLLFNQEGGAGEAWQVDLLAADGHRVLSGIYTLNGPIRLDLPRSLASGVYFVRAIGQQSGQHYVSPIVVL